MERIYFDISATTPIDSNVNDFMNKIQKNIYGNPSSIHREGQSAKAIIEKSRRQIANTLQCNPDEIIFTSGGTEANNMVLNGTLIEKDHLITSSYEHPAILKVLPHLSQKKIDISIVKPNKDGIISAESIKKHIKKNTKLISIMYANNELGTINPIYEIATLANNNNILFHSDTVQAFGKIPIQLNEPNIDFISISAHKLYGPKGCGALFKRNRCKLKPLIFGGNQEFNFRASTENIVGIAGFGLAAELAYKNLIDHTKIIKLLEEYFISILNKTNLEYKINGKNRIPGVFNLTFPEIDSQNLVMKLDINGIGISNGAACSSGDVKPSQMLMDIGLTELEALSTVRISFGKIHSKKEILKVANAIINIINNTKTNGRAHG